MAFKRRLSMADSLIDAEKQASLAAWIAAARQPARGHTDYAPTDDGAAKRVTVDPDGFIIDAPTDFRGARTVSPPEYAEIRERQVGYEDIQTEKIDIVAELAKL